MNLNIINNPTTVNEATYNLVVNVNLGSLYKVGLSLFVSIKGIGLSYIFLFIGEETTGIK
jgi:hypothetical protein